MSSMTLPQLFNLLRSFMFGPFLALGFLVGTFVFWKKGGEEYYDQNALMDAIIMTALWGILGARLGFILVHLDQFGFDLLKWFSLFAYPGYIGIAGIIAAFVFLNFRAQAMKWDVFEVADFGTLGLSIGAVFTYIGMLLNGSGFGNPTTWFVGMTFPGVFDRRHPVQLYAALLYLILFVVLWRLEGIYRTFLWYRSNKRTAQTGFLVSIFLIGYGLIGLALAPFQPSFLSIGGVHVEAVVRFIVLVIGCWLLVIRSGRSFFPAKKKPVAHLA